MTPKQRLELKRSEQRGKLSALLGKEDRTEAETSELESLTEALQGTEAELRAAIAAEAPADETETRTDTEAVELRAMVDKASLGNIITATLAQRDTEGAERELQAHFGLPSNSVPLELLATEGRAAEDPRIETRDRTPAPANVGTMQDPIIPDVFPQAAAAFLGVDMPTVGVGEHSYPVLTTSATVHAPGVGVAADDTTGAFAANVLAPSRLQAAFEWAREDAAKFAGMDAALRMNLADALADALDAKIIDGLIAGLANPADPGGQADFAAYRELAYGLVDGRYAASAADVRLLFDTETYRKASGIYRDAGTGQNDSALDVLMRAAGGVRVSAHMPAPAGANKVATIVAARGMARNAVAPIWQGVELIPDRITKAGTGEIVLTAIMLYSFAVLRAAGYSRNELQLEA